MKLVDDLLLRALAIVLLTGFATASLANTLTGRVISIGDGDTITVLDGANIQHMIRLAGIDAPEISQAFGNKSRSNLSLLVREQYVTINYSKRDRYSRIVGKVMAASPDSNCKYQANCERTVDVCLEQIRGGMAWWYRGYGNEQTQEDRGLYEQAEFNAKIRRIGLWRDTNPTPPWRYRHD